MTPEGRERERWVGGKGEGGKGYVSQSERETKTSMKERVHVCV